MTAGVIKSNRAGGTSTFHRLKNLTWQHWAMLYYAHLMVRWVSQRRFYPNLFDRKAAHLIHSSVCGH